MSKFRWSGGVGRWLVAIVVVAASAMVADRVVSQENGEKPKGPPAGGPSEEMMAKFKELGMPGPHHKHLEAMAGTWDAKGRFWWDPSAPPTEGRGTLKSKWVLGGRFLQDEYEGISGEEKFEGVGLTGYDNMKKKYVNIWADNMGTCVMISYGTCDPSGKTFTYYSEFDDPMSGGVQKCKMVSKIITPSKRTFEMFNLSPDGKEFKNLEITYVRK